MSSDLPRYMVPYIMIYWREHWWICPLWELDANEILNINNLIGNIDFGKLEETKSLMGEKMMWKRLLYIKILFGCYYLSSIERSLLISSHHSCELLPKLAGLCLTWFLLRHRHMLSDSLYIHDFSLTLSRLLLPVPQPILMRPEWARYKKRVWY